MKKFDNIKNSENKVKNCGINVNNCKNFGTMTNTTKSFRTIVNSAKKSTTTTNSAKSLNPKGFIVILAIIIFALLSVFGIIVQRIVIDAYRTIQATNDYYKARDISDSLIEYLQVELGKHDGGYNSRVICDFENGRFIKSKDNSAYEKLCTTTLVQYTPEKGRVQIILEVRGRLEEADKISGNCGNVFMGTAPDGCYMVPRAGQGTAGKDCNIFVPDQSSDQLNHPCNWNKLQFGSSNTERAVIPLFYENSSGEVVSPFFGGSIPDQFVVRIRTPECEEGAESQDCVEGRYKLDDSKNEVVVQWQINGVCDDNGKEIECGMVPWGRIDADGYAVAFSSLITKRAINNTELRIMYNNNVVLKTIQSDAIDTNDYSASGQKWVIYILNQIKKPRLTLLLNKGIVSAHSKKSIPYLEYQVLSVHPVSDSVKNIFAFVNVNGNVFSRSLYIDEEAGLIDFAIQN